jgi:short-subunit dehydrogenase
MDPGASVELMADKTALITGASSGIGAEFARQLAGQGYSLVLTARRKDKLEALAQEIQEEHQVNVEVLPADLSQEDGIQMVERRIGELDHLDLLVNNAGYGISGRFYKSDIQRQLDMIQVHVIASVRLARAVLPQMVERGRGGIINMSSMSAFVPSAGVTYSSTKTYMLKFSQALQYELYSTGVRVQALCPGLTYSEFHDTPEYTRFDRERVPRFLWLRAEAVVSESLRDLERGRVVCVPGRIYRLIKSLATGWLTGPLVAAGARRVLRRRRDASTINGSRSS